MKLSSLQRLGGMAIIVGAILLFAWAICWTTLLPVHERAHDPSLLVLSPHWIWIASLSLPAVILLLFGFTAVYTRIYQNAGVVGFIGYVFIVIAYIFQAAKITWEVFVYPVMVEYTPAIALFREKILMKHPQVILFRTLADLAILLGVVFFTIGLIRTREFPKIAGILILIGALIYAVGPLINIYLAIGGVFILACGCMVLGKKLLAIAQ
jgi:hypothetical protein